MAKQMNVIIDDEVYSKYKELLKSEGRTIQRDLESYIKARISACLRPGEDHGGKLIRIDGIGERAVS